MWQRIQTAYLLLIVILSGITLFSPLARLFNEAKALEYEINYKGIFLLQQTGDIFQSTVWGLTAIMVLVPVIAIITIGLYKRRILQLRLSIINMVLMAGFYALLFIYIWFAGQNLQTDWNLKLVSAFPLVNMVLNYLAIRGIGKDEALVKSLNRLR